MATTKSPNENFSMDDFDSLLSALNAEELENINDLVDPEVDILFLFIFSSLMILIIFFLKNSYLPAGDRCKLQTNKTATGPYDRTKLLDFLTEQGKNEKDWEQHKAYVPGEKKGKVWEPPPVVKPTADEDNEFLVSTEWDDVLTNANETEIVELAGSIFEIVKI